MLAISSKSVSRRRGGLRQQDSDGRKVKDDETKRQDSRIKDSKSKEVAPLVSVPSCANKAAPAAACAGRQPIGRRALCGVACAAKGSRTVEVRSSPQGNQSFGLRVNAPLRLNGRAALRRRIVAAVVFFCLAQKAGDNTA